VPIDHVVVLCLENRSFDHVLGFLEHPDPRFEGLRTGGPYANPGWDGGPDVPATPTAKRVLPFGPDHSHDAVMEQLAVSGIGPLRRATNSGFVSSYERKARGLAPPTFGGLLAPVLKRFVHSPQSDGTTGAGRGRLVMECQPPERVPVLARLALEFAVCDHWFCSVPGETWPNRNFLHAATSDGETNIELRPYTDCTIFERLEENGADWRIYHDDTPQVWAFPKLWDTPERHARWHPVSHFAREVAAGELPAYAFLEPNHRPPFHTLDDLPLPGSPPELSSSQHPENNLVSDAAYDDFDDDASDTDFARGERLVAEVYEALRNNPEVFARTLLLITYDEHGGLYDHVPPPTDVPPPADGKNWWTRLLHAIWHRDAVPFDFTMLGPRVPAVVVSPLVPRGTLDQRVHDHASVPATLRTLFAPTARPLTGRDAWATPFSDLATLAEPRTDLPDLSAYTLPPVPVAVPAPRAASAAGAAPVERVPEYYQEFLGQADQVRARLIGVGEPEITTAIASGTAEADPGRGEAITAAFAAAAHRHRHGPAGDPAEPAAASRPIDAGSS
jgi:phospholipase C